VKTLLRDCLALSPADGITGPCDLRIDGDTITERGRALSPAEGEEIVDIGGRCVIPGLVCAHTHLYSSLSRGMPPCARTPKNFRDRLRRIWWKLDSALDADLIYWSALAGALEGLRCGTTTILDHHASPNAIEGSLSLIREALAEAGVRGVLCYEVTDRGGAKRRDAGLRENERFIASCTGSATFRGLVGAHASFTLSDASLERCAELARGTRTGVHIHVAEDMADVQDARRRSHAGLMRRLERSGVASLRSVFAHCVHLGPEEFRALESSGAWAIHNPRSNMNNGVGHAPVGLFPGRSGLGTDGFPADMFEEARAGYFRAAEEGTGGRIIGLVAGSWRLAGELFGRRFGSVAPGSVADLVVLDYRPPTPLHAANAAGHFLFGAGSAAVSSVMAGGTWVLWNRAFPRLDEEAIARRASRAAARLWKRMEEA